MVCGSVVAASGFDLCSVNCALAPRKELPSLIPGCCSQPADVFLPNWMKGKPTAMEIHAISPLKRQLEHPEDTHSVWGRSEK